MAGPELGPAAKIGPYEIVRRLGAGGMGAVYLGHHEATREPAAVKLIRPEHTSNPEFRARLRREVAAARRVPRFCTAPVLAADPDAEPPWLATEYIDGPSLDVALLERQRLTGFDLEQFAVSVAVALRAIHAHGVVHRDLKPSNILLSTNGPRVIDFGIARLDDAGTHLTSTGVVLGTPAYMAPEQLRSEPLTGAVDVFAWASVVTYAATGQPPFGRGATALRAILEEQPNLAALTGPFRDLVAAAFDKDPARRPSAAELVERLSRSAAAVTTGVLAAATAAPNQPADPGTPNQPGDPGTPNRPADPGTPNQAADPATPDRPAGSVASFPLAAAPAEHPAPPVPPPVAAAAAPAPAPVVPPPPGPVAGPAVGWPGPVAVAVTDPRRRRRWAVAAGATAAGLAVLVVGITAIVVLPGLLDPNGRAGANPGTSTAPTTSTTPTTSAPASRPGATAAPEADLPPLGAVIGERLTGHTGTVSGVAFGERDGAPIAVSGGWHDDGTVRVWDLATMEPVGEPLTGHAGSVSSVAFGELPDGTPIAVSGGTLNSPSDGSGRTWDHTVRVWDLDRMEQIGRPLQGHADLVQSVAVGELDGAPIAVTASLDRTLRIWDLSTMEPVGDPLTGHEQAVYAVALSELDGVPIAVSGSQDETVRVWDLASREQIGELTGHSDTVWTVATGERDGIPIAVSGGSLDDPTLRVWDLTSMEQIGELTGHRGQILPVAVGEVGGTTVAVAASTQEPLVRVWNLDTMEQVGDPFDVHSGAINALALGELEGVPVAVSGGQDQTVRVWSLASPELVG